MRFTSLLARLCLASSLIWSGTLLAATEQAMDANLDKLFSSHENYHAFFDNFKTQIAAQNKAEVAKLISYPIKIALAGKKVQIKTPQQFIKNYDAIFTPDLVAVVNAQKYQDLFANYQGLAIGKGQIWFSGICQDNQCKKSTVLVIGINK
ncbi:hypothetical protein F3J27_00880 [Enterobacter sp. Ap-916]|uniref:hypothetical protein n=1 Tax=unclassified Enterobacter TaxID=2608935 RepID=UPI001421DA77|nr:MULTISPECIES: hypothetical protein [unclassified Enterobacter]NIF58021.1 hypothetical protein [Enterobacter sp. Ap-867]NIG28037.1 hypothetical protein [Enterobacter sp. Ap-916]